MRNLFKMVFQRVVFVSFAILIQLLFLILMVFFFDTVWRWFSIAMSILSFLAVLYILSDRTNPSYKLAWVIPILAFPIFGGILYIMFGGNKLSKRQKAQLQTVDEITRSNLKQDPLVLHALQQQNLLAASQAQYLIHCASSPVFQNTESTYYASGESCFPVMLQELRRAERYIFIEYFIIENGEMWAAILEILRQKAAAGVDVRVIYDDFGCITRLPMHYAKKLEKLGIRCHSFNPYIPILSTRLNNRDHRKFMIIDGRTAFTGGINLADEYTNRIARFGYWKDAGIRLRGDAVYAMTVQFLSIWQTFEAETDLTRYQPVPFTTAGRGFVQPYVDSPLDFEAVGETVYLNLIARARRYVYIMTPYLIIDNNMMTSLTSAAKSGIDVRIITPYIPDKRYVHALTRAHYENLIEAGVKIYEFTPGFIHSKVFCVDDEFATVGSINMDYRSLYLHFENGVLLYQADAIAAIRADFDQTFPVCHEVTLAECQQVTLITRIFRAVLRMLAPLM